MDGFGMSRPFIAPPILCFLTQESLRTKRALEGDDRMQSGQN